VPQADIVPTLVPLLEHFKHHRRTAEEFGDYCQRVGEANLQKLLPQAATANGAHGHVAATGQKVMA
jgi:hypothetical protein